MNDNLEHFIEVIAAIVISVLIMLWLLHTAQPVPPVGTIVSCSDYYKVTDMYSTPSGSIIVLDGITYDAVFTPGYGEPAVGKYYTRGLKAGLPYFVNLIPLTDNATYRDACMVT